MVNFHEIQEDKGVTRLIVSDKIEKVRIAHILGQK